MPPKMLLLRWFAKVYSWDQEIVGRQDLDTLTWFPLIEEAEAAAMEMIQKQATAAKRR